MVKTSTSTNTKETEVDAVKQSFWEILDGINPEMKFDAAREVGKINNAIGEYGGEGELTIRIAFRQSDKFPETARLISTKIDSKLPKKTYKDSVKFANEKGEIVSTDPNQQTFNFN